MQYAWSGMSSDNGASSSIYESDKEEWIWDDVKKLQRLTSTTIEDLIKQSNCNFTYCMCI